MKNIKSLAQIAVVIIAVLALGYVVWLSAWYFFSLNTQVSQNTQDIQGIVQFLNKAQGTSASPAPVTK